MLNRETVSSERGTHAPAMDVDAPAVSLITNKSGSVEPAPDLRLRPQASRPDGHRVVRQSGASEETLAEFELPANSPVSLEFFDGKGGFLGLIRSKASGLSYMALPGATVQLGDFRLEMTATDLETADTSSQESVPPATKPQTATRVAMILGAGLSSRIEPGPHYTRVSKPGFPLDAEGTIIGRLASHVARHGITDILVNTHLHPASVKRGLDRLAGDNLRIHYIDEDQPSGTAGGLAKALTDSRLREVLGNQPLVVLQGDGVMNLDLSELVRAHQAHNAAVTVGCQTVAECDLDKFGIVVTDKSDEDGVSGNVTRFMEKPGLEKAGDHRLGSTGVYVLAPEIFPLISRTYEKKSREKNSTSHEVLDFAKDVFPGTLEALKAGELTANGQPMTMWAHKLEGYWSDVGNLFQYFVTLNHLERGLLGEVPPLEGFYRKGVVFWGPDTQKRSDNEGVRITGNVIVSPDLA